VCVYHRYNCQELISLLQGASIRQKRQHSKPLLKTFYNRSRKAVVDWKDLLIASHSSLSNRFINYVLRIYTP